MINQAYYNSLKKSWINHDFLKNQAQLENSGFCTWYLTIQKMDKGQLIFNVVVDFNSESFFIGKKGIFYLRYLKTWIFHLQT